MPEVVLHDGTQNWTPWSGSNGVANVRSALAALTPVTSSQAASGKVISNTPAGFVSVYITVTGTAVASAVTTFYDNATVASGTVIGIIPGNAVAGTTYNFGFQTVNGIYASGAANGPGFNVGTV